MAFQEVLYRPAFGRVLAVVTIVVCAAGIVALFWQSAADALRYVWPILLVAVLAWALFWRPSLQVQQHGVTVVNVLRHALRAVAGDHADRDALLAHAAHREAEGAPSGRRPLQAGTARSGSPARTSTGSASPPRASTAAFVPADAISTPTGNLAQVIRGHWEGLRDAGLLAPGADPDAETMTWHWATIAAIALLTVATVVGLLI